jgi:hypothetical protein
MPDFYQKITDMHGSIEELARKIPGFKGYFEKEDRRAADRLLREKLSHVFGESLEEFTRLQRQLIDAGGMQHMEKAKVIDVKLRTFIDKVESAADGYAGLFDPVKVDEGSLAGVYAFDNALLAYRDQLATGLKEFGDAIGSEEIGPVLDELENVVVEIVRVFDRRVEAMQGMQDSV